MRDIDTDVLLPVARSLKIANPATATRPVTFDDENLQQIWAAEKFSRLPALTATFRETFSAAMSTVARSQFSVQEVYEQGDFSDSLAELGLEVGNSDVYVVGFQANTTDDTNMEECGMAVKPYVPNLVGANAVTVLEGTGGLGINLVEAGGVFPITNNLEPEDYQSLLPMRLSGGLSGPTQDVLFMMGSSDAGGATFYEFVWKLHFCLRDVPLWYVL